MSSLSLLATYDDIIRCQAALIEDDTEVAFRAFLDSFDEYKAAFLHIQTDNNRLQRELDDTITSMSVLETKLSHARRLLEMETRLRKDAEQKHEQVEKMMRWARELLKNDRGIRDETRDQLAFLNSPRKRRSMMLGVDSIHEETVCDDINSTGSLLSDMSVTKSEDDFLDCHTSKQWRRHRPSGGGGGAMAAPSTANSLNVSGKRLRLSTERKRRSSSRLHDVDHHNRMDRIVASTKLSVPRSGDGPIVAESTITTTKPPMSAVKRTAPQPPTEDNAFETPRKDPSKATPFASKRSRSPTAPPCPSTVDEEDQDLIQYATVQKQILRTPGPATFNTLKRHQFIQKSIFVQSESCSHCGKRIRFSANCLKCRDCRATLHMQCRDAFTSSCIPATATTPNHRGGKGGTAGNMGTISDYAPSIGPMVPALIVHCVNEIEARGLNEEGLYRLCGSDLNVKQLKEAFLRGKSIPPVNSADIHTLCGCIKDFLKSLDEMLIPTAMWADFSNAAQNVSPEGERKQLYDAILRLPQANRDTLAFLIQHFQRIAACPKTKMNLENLARVFAPTIVGYSNRELEGQKMYAETVVNVAVLQSMLRIPTQFWMQFVNVQQQGQGLAEEEQRGNRVHAAYPVPSFVDAPSSALRTRKDKKFYGTPPYNTVKRK